MPEVDRSYVVGTTIFPRVRVSQPGTRKPVDPSLVEVVRFTRDGVPVTLSTTSFTRVALGDFQLSIPTGGFVAGVYDVLIRVFGGGDKVVMVSDRFVLTTA